MTDLAALFDWHIPGAYLHGAALLGALAAFGLVVGVLTGLFGVGGGFLITPLLSIGFGIPYDLVIGSSLSFTIGTASSGMSRHMRLGNFEPRATLILAAGCMAGALAGGTLNDTIAAALGPGRYTHVIDVLYIVMLTLTAWVVAREAGAHPTGKTLAQRLPLGPRIDLPAAGLAGVSLPALILVGLAIGLLSGMLGIGGGVLFMPLLVVVIGLTPHQAVGTSLGVVVFGATAGTIKYGLAGKVNLVIVMALLVSSVFGVQLGAWLCHRLHATRLRRYFALLVILVAVTVAVRLGASLLGAKA